MKPKTLIMLGLAIVCGLGASYMTSQYLASRDEITTVVMAKQRIDKYTIVTKPGDLFEEKEIPRSQAPLHSISRLEDLKDRTTSKEIEPGRPVVIDDLQQGAVGIEEAIRPGFRAVAVKVEAPSAVGGWVQPGSHVDVIHSGRRNCQRTNAILADSRYILSNILVRAVDLQPDRNENRPGGVPATVILEVSVEDARKLERWKQLPGQITLALRRFGDRTPVEIADDPCIQDEMAQVTPILPPAPPEPFEQEMDEPEEELERFTQLVWNGKDWARITYIVGKDGTFRTETMETTGSRNPEERQERSAREEARPNRPTNPEPRTPDPES